MDRAAPTPEDIRKLRGDRSRAAFARELGVTPLTVYRWELPDGAPEARRPRGRVLERLLRATAPDARAPEETDAWAAFVGVFGIDWRASQSELLRIAGDKDASPDALALAGAGLAFVEIAIRSSARAGFSAIAPALRLADTGSLSPAVEAYVQAVGALVAAIPDADLFDVGRVHARAEIVSALAQREPAPEARVIADLATLAAAFVAGGQELLNRAVARVADLPPEGLPPHLELIACEIRSIQALVAGQPILAAERFERVRALADEAGFAPALARGLANLAVRRLDDLGDPEAALDLARRSKAVASEARLGPGLHAVFAWRAEVEALVRLGRFDDARAVLDEVDGYARDVAPPPFAIVPTYARFCFLTGDVARLGQLRATLHSVRAEELRGTAEACMAYLEALSGVSEGRAPSETLVLFDVAEERAAGWWTLLREILVFSVPAAAATGRPGEARVRLRRAYRFLERYPSPWALAQARRFDGIVSAVEGHPDEGRRLLEASIASFELASDRPDAVMSRLMLHVIERHLGVAGAEERIRAVRLELEAMGASPPRLLAKSEALLASALGGRAPASARAQGLASRLVLPVERLASRGTSAPLIERELEQVTREVFPGRAVHLGRAPDRRDGITWVDLPDGSGGELALGVSGDLDAEERSALSILGVLAGIALENASLRGLGRGATAPIAPTTAPFVAASPAMKKLAGEIARMGDSRATVVIQGESGTGKEVVARAIHAGSSRRGKELVAFNCAAVPRELFEGQLFGYRRGAFTGALKDSPGVVRSADGGTLFLDEIGELPPEVQPKLLRFLENGEVFPLGDKRPVVVDVRVLAATHRDLLALVREGRFREDLYYRLQVVPLRLPPLRERREDVLPLARHFLVALAAQRGTTPPALSPDAAAALQEHRWQGNVRELRNVVERALAFAPLPRVLHREHLAL